MVLLNELSKFLVCRSSLTQSSDFLYNVIDIGGELVATLLMMLFTGWCCVHKLKRIKAMKNLAEAFQKIS